MRKGGVVRHGGHQPLWCLTTGHMTDQRQLEGNVTRKTSEQDLQKQTRSMIFFCLTYIFTASKCSSNFIP